ncbi:MAG: LysR family transcriptional regulator [Janthinobacterium lividum]
MDLRQLRTFKLVAELGSLSKASDRLRVAQPALSRQVKLLEHELQTALFVRNGRGMMLTDAGRLLLERTAGLVRQIEQVRDDMRSAGGAPAGTVALGLVPTVSNVVSAGFARRVAMELPGIALRIVESYGGHLVEWLHRGELDLAIIYGPAVDLHLAVRPIGRDDVVAVGPPGCGLRQRGSVTLAWLLRQRLILPSYSHGLRALIETAAARRGSPLDIVMEADSYRVLTSLVAEGLGYTVLPPSAIRLEVEEGRLETAAIISPAITRELILAAPSSHPPSIASAAISAVLLAEVARLATAGLWSIRLAGDQATA